MAAALACAVAIHPQIAATHEYTPAYAMTDAVREQVNTSPFAMILGELRVSAADMMWIKTERYLHLGISYAPHIDAEALAHSGDAEEEASREPDDEQDPIHTEMAAAAAKQAPAEAEHEHEGEEKPLAPSAAEDYRGFIGTIQRNVQPWGIGEQFHQHQGGQELIPWYRVLTLSNPHHIRGYLTGSWWLMKQESKEPGSTDEALKFISEGVANNPTDFELPLMQGRILLAKDRVREAIASFRKSAELALAVRPEGGVEKLPEWSYWEEEDFSAAVHYVPALYLEKLHDPAAALDALDWADKLLPGDGRLAALRRQAGGEPPVR
jgi:tetratricopeptide (TPR) repeat protein